MRFHRLSIPAFGPFTDFNLSFPNAGHDLHLFYGENEAGKSSLLRAIHDLLFGIDGRSTDNFLHEYKNLRLIGELENRAGQRLLFQRRKGSKSTLLNEVGEPIEDSALAPFLGSVDAAYFSTMFGLGRGELRDGAKELLRGEGEMGSALFSASLGGTPIQRVAGAIIEESEQLFKGRASANVSIRPAANRYKELLKQSRESMVAVDVWEQIETEIKRQQFERDRLDKEIAGFEMESDWVGRCEDALPSVGRYNEEMKLLRELPPLPDVGSDFVERARSARNGFGESTRKVEEHSTQIAQIRVKLGECATTPDVMAVANELDALHQELGAYRTRKEIRTNLQSKLAAIEPVLLSGMSSLGIQGDLESLERLRLTSADRLSLENAAKILSEVTSKREEADVNLDGLRSNIETHRRDLDLFPETDLEPLRAALDIAAGATEAHQTLEISRTAVENLLRKVRDEQSLVIGAPEERDTAARLPIPSSATIRKFRERLSKLEQEEKLARTNAREQEAKIIKLREELTRLERRGELPTKESLKEARERRNHGWRLVLQDWKGTGAMEQLDPLLSLEEAFPKSIEVADQIADRLHLEADSVAQAEEKRLQILACQTSIDSIKAQLDANQKLIRECQDAWVSEWSAAAIQPRSPDEMEEWREAWTRFRETLAKLLEAESAFQSKIRLIQSATDTLATVLKDSPAKSFAILFETARKQVQQGEESTGRRKQIIEQIGNSQREIERLTREAEKHSKLVDIAKTDWLAKSQEAGLPTDIPPQTGLSLVRERKELITKFDQWKEWSGEANQTTVALEAYGKRVSELATQLQVKEDSTEAREVALWKILSSARTAQTAYDQLSSQLTETKDRLRLAQQEETTSRQIIHELMSLASIQSMDELEPLLAGLEKRSEIQRRLDALRVMLGSLARGATVEEFIARTEAENVDELPLRKVRVETRKAETSKEIESIRNALFELRRKRDELAKAGDAAADYRQQAESVAATLKLDASRFIRLRLATHFLKEQIEQFRKENQGPLLEKSGKVFNEMTRGRFDGLAAEFNNQDIPVLMGRRRNGTNVPVDGMSEGTRDQLYLSLRLAALDRHLENHEPMPLILDDLLMTFDNPRAGAILSQLAVLSKRTQVFLFTHHEHLVELCRQSLGEGNYYLHSLEEIRTAGSAFNSTK